MRRRSLLAAAPMVLPGLAARAQGPAWPDRPVRLVVPYAAGGPTDVVARLVAEAMSAALPQRVLVENRAGAGALLGTEAVARAPRDGHTLLFTTVVHAVHRALHGARLAFDPAADFAPVALVGVVPMVVLVPPASPARDMAELVALLKRGGLAYGSSGAGGSSHLGVELLKAMTGAEAEHIPYRGTGPALQDLLAGRIALLMDSVATGAPQVRSGALRGLATTGESRSAALPELPILAETVPGFAATTWNAVLAPAGTPAPVVEAAARAVSAALDAPGVAPRLPGLGVEAPAPAGRTPAAAGAFIAAETAKWEKLIREAGIKAD